MNKTNDNKKNSQLLKSIAPFLQAVQKCHEVITAAERALFVSCDIMEGCDLRLFIQPDGVGIGIPAWCFIHIQHTPSAVTLSTRRAFQPLEGDDLIGGIVHLAQRQQLYAVTLVV